MTRRFPTFALIALGLACNAPPARSQDSTPARVVPPPPPPPSIDTVRMPNTGKPVAVRSDALLPANRIIAYYGNPLSTRMGILGEIPPDQMMAKLEATAKQWQQADSTRTVKPALHLIATVAQGHAGESGKYRIRHSDSLIARVARWAETKNWLLFLDIQVGHSTIADEIPRLIPWLRKPNVHLALDPEFAMRPGHVPGRQIGTLDARDVNHAVDVLAKLVDEGQLPPKVLVVHRFTEKMLTNVGQIRADPRVQVVVDMDGFGNPGLKQRVYDVVISRQPVPFTGLKLFYKNDKPMLTFTQVLAMKPVPLYIQYQ